MKKSGLSVLVFVVGAMVASGTGGYEPEATVVEKSERFVLERVSDELGFKVVVLPYASRVELGNVYYNIVVQDILGVDEYEKANMKDFSGGNNKVLRTRAEVVPISLENNESNKLILFNLDIYAYVTDEKGLTGDPRSVFADRVEYTSDLAADMPVRIQFRLSEYRTALQNRGGVRSFTDDDESIGMYYFDHVENEWYPLEYLEQTDAIEIEIDDGIVTVQINRWPKDDRLHSGP